ncbi:response regulator [Sporomusa acidovorans]|uniref:response regulator n=1 Tax=Sporomusa acidovorans TaxID=112900 RepID=UPI00088C8F70|nr:response regulator [Sporomusa acidovorans]OZC19021.1 chemotaxis protein CheY [Sporomusa acidovorans DSM 3132]SDD73381.1 Response regulator receiver domain-containing protein [Sporomusa acidovorans]
MEQKISDRIKESYDQAQILVIDDSIFSRTLITRELLTIGFNEEQVQQAGSGRAALEKIKEKTFDLFIIDIIMDDVDGVTVLKEVKRTQPAAKIIMCSSRNAEDAVQESVCIGIDAFIVKPHTSEIFQKVVHRILLSGDEPGSAQDDAIIWHAKCHVCGQKMVEVNAMDVVSFYCPQNCMKLGPWSIVLVNQSQLDRAYGEAKRLEALDEHTRI